jgi:hypothetical protein
MNARIICGKQRKQKRFLIIYTCIFFAGAYNHNCYQPDNPPHTGFGFIDKDTKKESKQLGNCLLSV